MIVKLPSWPAGMSTRCRFASSAAPSAPFPIGRFASWRPYTRGHRYYSLFGIHSFVSEALLFAWATTLVLICYVVFAECMERLQSPKTSVLGGLVLLALVPLYTTKEVFDFRVWDGALGLALGAILLNILLAAQDENAAPRHLHVWLAVLPPLVFFVSPPIGLASVLAEGVFLLRHRRRLKPWKVIGGLLLTFALLVGPWTARNERLLGSPIWLRDDLGLELAVANYPSAVRPFEVRQELEERLKEIHPRNSNQAYLSMLSYGGEAAYSYHLKRLTIQWMSAHPLGVTVIWFRHLKEMIFTSPWMFQNGPPGMLAEARSLLVALLAGLGIVGLITGLKRDPRYAYLGAYVVVPIVCYLPFQPISRYTWLIYPLAVFLAADFIVRLPRARGGRVQDSGAGPSRLRNAFRAPSRGAPTDLIDVGLLP